MRGGGGEGSPALRPRAKTKTRGKDYVELRAARVFLWHVATLRWGIPVGFHRCVPPRRVVVVVVNTLQETAGLLSWQ